MTIDTEPLVDGATKTIHTTQVQIVRTVEEPETSLQHQYRSEKAGWAIDIDVEAESYAMGMLKKSLRRHCRIEFKGEEKGVGRRPTGDLPLVMVQADMLDGSDNLERSLGNWASALVFYNEHKILASFVGLPESGCFFAVHDREGGYRRKYCIGPGGTVLRRTEEDETVPVRGPDPELVSIEQATIAFYGQKPDRMIAMATTGFYDGLKRAKDEIDARKTAATEQRQFAAESLLKIYNLGGAPLMIKVVAGFRRIGAVVEVVGQRPHDFVPAAYIALKAGAHLCRFNDGQPITEDDLHQLLLTGTRQAYVLAATQDLALDIRQQLFKQPLKL